MSTAVSESIRAIDGQSWIIGDKLILSHEAGISKNNITSGKDGFSYAFREVTGPLPGSRPGSTVPFPLMYDACDIHAVWKAGDSFLKVIIPDSQEMTREHITPNGIRHMLSGTEVNIPEVLYHGEWNGRYYLIVTGMPGQTLDRVWPQMDETNKTRCIKQVALFCSILSRQKADQITGVDGRHLPEGLLADKGDNDKGRFNLDLLLHNCQELGMDCSTFLLYHCDLSPSNILVDPKCDSISVIDFECVGFVPVDWIRTKFRISSGMDFDFDDYEDENRSEWRTRMQRYLGEGNGDMAMMNEHSMIDRVNQSYVFLYDNHTIEQTTELLYTLVTLCGLCPKSRMS